MVTVAIGLGSVGAVEVTDGWEISKIGNDRVSSAMTVPKKSENVLLGARLAEVDRLEDWDKLPGCIKALGIEWIKDFHNRGLQRGLQHGPVTTTSSYSFRLNSLQNTKNCAEAVK